MRLRYIGRRPFRLILRDQELHLRDGDVVDLDPWKIRSTRLMALFEVAEENPEALSKADKKFLESLNGFADTELYTEKKETLKERLDKIEEEKNK